MAQALRAWSTLAPLLGGTNVDWKLPYGPLRGRLVVLFPRHDDGSWGTTLAFSRTLCCGERSASYGRLLFASPNRADVLDLVEDIPTF